LGWSISEEGLISARFEKTWPSSAGSGDAAVPDDDEEVSFYMGG